jgi:ribosomal protein S18 acetylase RimI-like enzyme
MNSILPTSPAELETLVRMSRKIFHDSFAHLNTPDNMREYMDRAFNPQQLLSELNNPLSEFYFIREDGVIAGFIKLNRGPAQSDIHDDTSLEIERIYVDKEFQGHGLGAELIAKAKERAFALELNAIWLGVWEKNPDAIRFYERHGFVRFGSHPFRMGDEIQTDVLMKCKTVRQ